MRSRQRNTFKRMLVTIPLVTFIFLILLTIILNKAVNFFDGIILVIEESEFYRILKAYENISENLKVNVDKNKSIWEESAKIVKHFLLSIVSPLAQKLVVQNFELSILKVHR